ncbi:hypothetical protein BTVI_122296 [Pitangus sulphuratus]|nr:hypothetical protein BTVI_122296 [Pitangus sulphuratus]
MVAFAKPRQKVTSCTCLNTTKVYSTAETLTMCPKHQDDEDEDDEDEDDEDEDDEDEEDEEEDDEEEDDEEEDEDDEEDDEEQGQERERHAESKGKPFTPSLRRGALFTAAAVVASPAASCSQGISYAVPGPLIWLQSSLPEIIS